MPAADPALRGIDPKKITLYLRRVAVVGKGEVLGMAVWRERLFAAMHLNPNLPAAYFVVPTEHARPTSVNSSTARNSARVPDKSCRSRCRVQL